MKRILIIASLLVAFVLLALPVLALSDEALNYTIKLAATLAEFREITFNIILWFIFLSIAAFVIYFITNTLMLVDNNRRYRYIRKMTDVQKTAELKQQQQNALMNVKSSEKRLVIIGFIIIFFAFLYVLFSAYFYLDSSIVENMWPIIYYSVGGLAILVILYSIAFVARRVQYASLLKSEPSAIRLYSKIQVIKQRLKLFVLCIMLLIFVYITLLIVIARSVRNLGS